MSCDDQQEEREMNMLDDVKLLISWHQLRFQTHVLVVLLQVDQLLPHSFDLALDVHPGHVGVIQDFLQPSNVSLYRLPDGQLIVKPAAAQEGENIYILTTICKVCVWTTWKSEIEYLTQPTWL